MSTPGPSMCPLCQTPVASSDDLQLHYLTSCSGYDKAEEPPPRSKLEHGGGEASASAGATADDTSTVQFMWQPLTEMTYPKITLLASFECGSVELSLDPEGSYYASDRVTIKKGTYEGQLVIGDSFVNPVKNFTIEKDDNTVILQFEVSHDRSHGEQGSHYGGDQYGSGYMQRNPSYNQGGNYGNQGYSNYQGTGTYGYGTSGSGDTRYGVSAGGGDTHYGRSAGGYYEPRSRHYGTTSASGGKYKSTDGLPTSDFEYHPQYPATYNEPRNSPVGEASAASRDHTFTQPPIMQESAGHASQPDTFSRQLSAEGFGPVQVKSKGGISSGTTTSTSGYMPDNSRPSASSSHSIVTGISTSSATSQSIAHSSQLNRKETPQVVRVPDASSQTALNDMNAMSTGGGSSGFNVSQLQQDREELAMGYERQMLELREQLETVTKERDSLLDNHERVKAQWEGRVRRLEQQLKAYQRGETPAEVDSVSGSGSSSAIAELESQVTALRGEVAKKEKTERQLMEMKDRNAALEEQLSEYMGAVRDQSKVIQGTMATNKAQDAEMLRAQQQQIHLTEYMKKQQLEYEESLSSIKKKIGSAEKIAEENLKLHQLNVSLTGELEDYRTQTKLLLADLKQKEEEIVHLKEQPLQALDRSSPGSSARDRLELELETMKQKCDAWRQEVEKLVPLRNEKQQLQAHISELEEQCERLRLDNDGLGRQLQSIMEESERKQAEMARKGMDYDILMQRFTELQQIRATLENELGPLREEREAIFRENAQLQESSQPEKYAKLKEEHALLLQQCEHYQTALENERAQVQLQQQTNVQLQQTLNEATNPEQLQSIRDRVERYRLERDQARKQTEEVQSRLHLLEIDNQSQQKLTQELQGARETSEQQIVHLRNDVSMWEQEARASGSKLQEYETRMRRYREERDQARASSRTLEVQLSTLQGTVNDLLRQSQAQAAATMDSGGPDSMDYSEHTHYPQPSSSPTHGHSYVERPEYSPQHYEDQPDYMYSENPPQAAGRSNRRKGSNEGRSTGRSSTSSSSSTLPSQTTHSGKRGPLRDQPSSQLSGTDDLEMFPTNVRTKRGVVKMVIQKPTVPLNNRNKPRVIVKRGERGEESYETGRLMFVGNLGGKETAGIHLDLQRLQSPGGKSSFDGTYRDGQRYFSCPPGFGLYLPLSKVYVDAESATL